MKFIKFIYAQGWLLASPAGFGSLMVGGMLDDVEVSFTVDSDDAWALICELDINDHISEQVNSRLQKLKFELLAMALISTDRISIDNLDLSL